MRGKIIEYVIFGSKHNYTIRKRFKNGYIAICVRVF